MTGNSPAAHARTLILGGAGQLARALHAALPGSSAPSRRDLSISDPDRLAVEISSRRPEIVFNCAAYNAVDRAEEDPEAAREVNALGAENVARACHEVRARLVHFSTNYVFDGRADRPYREEDQPNPLGWYARSKREGELRVLEAHPGALVIRSAGLFGHGGSAVKGGSLPHRLVEQARSGVRLSVVSDQRLNPTFTGHLAAASIAAAGSGMEGVIHLVARDCCSIYEFACGVLEVAGIDAPVEAITTSPESDGSQRPRNGCLESTRCASLPSWREGLAAFWRDEVRLAGKLQ